MHNTPSFKEDHISQIPALILLQNMGYIYLTPEETLKERHGKKSKVILEGILEAQLRKINHINFKGKKYEFSDSNIKNAIEALKDYHYEGLINTNEKIYDLLCLGKSFEQNMDGDKKSFNLKYIDWKNIKNNIFHVTAEFEVSRTGSNETRRPDIVLFVNGIPLSVIECKRPDIKEPLAQAISQNIRNQKDNEIPGLFVYSQILMALTKNEGKYATTGTKAKFWSLWREEKINETEILEIINTPLTEEQRKKLFSPPFACTYFDRAGISPNLLIKESKARYGKEISEIESPEDKNLLELIKKSLSEQGEITVTEQDRLIYSLLKPDRFIELIYNFILYDCGVKKIARYQQYFAVKNTLERVTEINKEGKRQGGVIWHTQGSGKYLTMVMMAKALSLEPSISDPRIILVTDRVDLDDQIYKTFHQCGKDPVQATSGEDLVSKIKEKKEIITTIIDKFETAGKKRKFKDTSHNIFVLVDESHRSQYGVANATMGNVLPEACYIGFTGTPLMKKDKNTARKFGGIIDTYTIDRALKDKAVVPLLYEGRHVVQEADQISIDSWFKKISKNLTEKQKTDLKRKFSTADRLNEAEQKIASAAYDISEHFKKTWKNTSFKGQLTAPSKIAALKYKKYLDDFGDISSEILISGPDTREGHEDVFEETKSEVQIFWKNMMNKYGNEKNYNKQVINSFKNDDYPEIIIVVDKLLTGFDAPRNVVLYITRNLRDHKLLQAIARVNRLYDNKEFGYIIDYYGLLGDLDKALADYTSLEDFDNEDIEGLLKNITEEINTLPQKHSDLREIFKEIKNKSDEEAYERLLSDEVLRDNFYERLTDYAKTLSVAMSSGKYLEETPEEKINNYKKDLRFFLSLRKSVKRRYSDEIDYRDYEPKIRKLIDTYIPSNEILQITEPVNIFETEKFQAQVEECKTIASQADTIAYRTEKTIEEKLEEEPVFYTRFSKLLKDTIENFKNRRISEKEYLETVKGIMVSVRDRTGDEIPDKLKHRLIAKAFYGIVLETLNKTNNIPDIKDISADTAIAIDDIIQQNKIVDWVNNTDTQNKMRNEIEDSLYEINSTYKINLTVDDIDKIMEQAISIARVRYS